MRISLYTSATAASALGLLLVVIVGTAHHTEQASAFYKGALAKADVEETLTVGQDTYRVVNDHVYRDGREVTGFATLPALKLAYDVTLARRDPLFALPGTDPVELTKAVAALPAIEEHLASLQANAHDRALALRVYPTNFLRRAAELEQARQLLIAAPTPQKADAYARLIPQVMHEKEKAVTDFASAFRDATKGSADQVGLFTGLLSSTTLQEALSDFVRDLPHEQATVAARTRCDEGLVEACAAVPPVATTSTPTVNAPVASGLAPEVLSLWDSAFGSKPLARSIAYLPRSVCLPHIEGPIQVALSTRTIGDATYTTISYVGDMFFYRLSTLTSPYALYMRNTNDVEYSFLNPFKFYTCPEIGIDQGSAVAAVRLAEFARARTTKKLTIDAEHQREELALMTRLKSGGLDDIVKDIAAIMTADLTGPLQAVGNTHVSYVFLTRSAFPTFFRIGTRTDMPRSLYKDDEGVRAAFAIRVTTYSSLRHQVSQSKILHDLRSFLTVENKIASTTPSTPPAAR